MTSDGKHRYGVLAAVVFAYGSHVLLLMSFPPMMESVSTSLKMSHTQEGLLMSAVYLAAILLATPFGRYLDGADLRRTGLWGLGIMLPGTLMCAFPPFGLMLAGRFLVGIGGLVTNLVAGAAIGRFFRGRELGLAMGIFHTLFPAVTLLNFLFVRNWARDWGWKWVVLATGCTTVVALVAYAVLWRSRTVHRPVEASQGEAYGHNPAGDKPALASHPQRNLLFALLIISWSAFCFAGSIMLTFGSAFMAEVDGDFSRSDMAMVCLMAGVLPGSPLIGKLADRLGEFVSILLATAMAGLVLNFLFAMRIGPPAVVLFMFGFLHAGGLATAIYSLVAEMFPGKRLGASFGILLTFSNLGSLLGPFCAGIVRDHSTSHAPGMLMMTAVSSLMIIAGLVFAVLTRRPRSAT